MIQNINANVRNADPNKNYTYTATGLPPGVVIFPNTGVITSLPQIRYSAALPGQVAVYGVTVTATDNTGQVRRSSFNWTVSDKNPIRVIDDRFNKVGDTATLIPEVLFPGLLEPGYTVSVTGLPTGLTANASGVVTGQTTAPGLFTVTVSLASGGQTSTRQFFWSVTNPAAARIEGPSVVLAGATYSYKVYWNQNIAGSASYIALETPGGVVAPGASMSNIIEVLENGATVSSFSVTYPSWVEKYVLTAKLNFQTVAQLPITAASVFIRDPEAGQAFTPGTVNQRGSGAFVGGYLNDVFVTSLEAFRVQPQQFGLEWKGKYGVIGPNGGQGVTQIQIGFIQHVTINTASADYADGTRLTHYYFGEPLTGQTFLDAGVGSVWYGTPFTPTPGNAVKEFQHNDNPRMQFAMSSDKLKVIGPGNPAVDLTKALTRTTYSATFTLNFAAQTLDPFAVGQPYSFGHATWSWSADGTVAEAGDWTGGVNAVVTVLSPTSWQLLTHEPTPINTDGPAANEIGAKLDFI